MGDSQFTVGILGCALIAKKNCRAARSVRCRVSAVASRSDEKAHAFVDEVLGGEGLEAPTIFAGGDDAYDCLLSSEESRSVYIPLPTTLHERYVARALASKHVLLEKPVAASAASYRQMLEAASRGGRLLMDGTMFVHHPRTRDFAASVPGANRVDFEFTFDPGEDFLANDIRLRKDGDFMGCVGDLGWYCVRMGLLVFAAEDDAGALRRGLVEEAQVTRCRLNEEGVPYDADCIVYFSEDRILSFHCSFVHPLNQTVKVSGTSSEYTAVMTDAILPLAGDTISYSLVRHELSQYAEITTETTRVVTHDNSRVQEARMWDDFVRWARAVEASDSTGVAHVEDEVWWVGDDAGTGEANAMAAHSLRAQIVLDALMESIRSGGARVGVAG